MQPLQVIFDAIQRMHGLGCRSAAVSSPGDPYYQSRHWRELKRASRARDAGLCAVPGCNRPGVVCDHVLARPPVPYQTDADRLDNVRLLCRVHDSQCKESRRGDPLRQRGGRFTVRGCDVDGWPLDPERRR